MEGRCNDVEIIPWHGAQHDGSSPRASPHRGGEYGMNEALTPTNTLPGGESRLINQQPL